ncbi:MAG: porphobilinogen synthase [Candidatus Omnitrophota bacterium]
MTPSARTAVVKKLSPAAYGFSLIMPYFVVEGKGIRNPVASMPGVFQLSVDNLINEVRIARKRGIPAVLLFGIPAVKDLLATEAYAPEGIVPQAVRAVKQAVPGMLVITDVCLCEYMIHGHCGVVKDRSGKRRMPVYLADFIDIKKTLELLSATALAQARAGADMVAPSAMMPRQVGAIRAVLDTQGFKHIPIMGYSAKYASAFYGPFRDAAQSAPKFGDRSLYQLDPADALAALQEVAADIDEEADIVMVKPALPYLDVIQRVSRKFKAPLAAYNVSGEYAMVKAAAANGWMDEKKTVLEILTAIKRAGASIIISYHACDAVPWLREKVK